MRAAKFIACWKRRKEPTNMKEWYNEEWEKEERSGRHPDGQFFFEVPPPPEPTIEETIPPNMGGMIEEKDRKLGGRFFNHALGDEYRKQFERIKANVEAAEAQGLDPAPHRAERDEWQKKWNDLTGGKGQGAQPDKKR